MQAHGRLKEDNIELEASLGYILRPWFKGKKKTGEGVPDIRGDVQIWGSKGDMAGAWEPWAMGY